MKQVIEQLSEQRERLDAVKTAIGNLPNSRGKALSFTALEKGRMYSGEVLRELGKEYPYEATKKATTVEGIQEAVDKATTQTPLPIITGNEIVDLNNLRDILEKENEQFLTSLENISKPKEWKNYFAMNCKSSEAYRSLLESRMWLGIRLGELRDLAK